MFIAKKAACAVVAALGLSACGGGGGSEGGGAPAPTTLSGKVVDGYIQGATVCLDLDASQTCDSGEPDTVSGAGGAYTLNVGALSADQLATLQVLVDVPLTAKDADDSGLTLLQAGKKAYTLMAPASEPGVVSPLTTLVVHASRHGGLDPGLAKAVVRDRLRLPGNVDPMQDFIGTNQAGLRHGAAAMAVVMGEVRAAIDASGVAVDARLKQTAVLETVFGSAYDFIGLSARPSPDSIRAQWMVRLNQLATPAHARIVLAHSAAAPVDLHGAGFHTLSSCILNGCTPQVWVTRVSDAGVLTSGQYRYPDNLWAYVDDYEAGASTADLNPATGEWVANPTAGTVQFDPQGRGGVRVSASGLSRQRVAIRQLELAGLSPGQVWAEGGEIDLIFPAGSRAYIGELVQQSDDYQLSTDTWVTDSASQPFVSFDAFLQAYRTTPANLATSPRYNDYSFDAEGATETGGTLTFYILGHTAKGRYEWRKVGGQTLLVITDVPSQYAGSIMYGHPRERFFALKDGKLYRGRHLLPGQVQTDLNAGLTLNLTAANAVLGLVGVAALP